MIRKKITILLIIVAVLSLGCLVHQAYALNLNNAFNSNAGTPLGNVVAQTNYSTAYSVPEVIGSIISIVLSILGMLFIFLMVYGGYLWMTAMGNETQSTKAKDLIQAAVIGLIIMLAAYAISYFITNALISPFTSSSKSQTTQVEQSTTPQPQPTCTQNGCPN